MINLKMINTRELLIELETREGVKSTYVTEEEFSRIQISGNEDKHLRYIKGYGPLKILEIKL